MLKISKLIYLSAMFMILSPIQGSASNCLLFENFDDQVLDDRCEVYGHNWAKLSPPQYNLTAAGRNGTGYAFASGTVNEANMYWGADKMITPWPTDEMYVSFWMRYPTFKKTAAMENIKLFYPHWNKASSYVHFSLATSGSIYYSASAKGKMMTMGNWLECPNQTDGQWHHYEFYIKFSEGVSRFWYDGALKVDDAFGTGVWTNEMFYISVPSIDGEAPIGSFSREVDDWEVWDGMPDPVAQRSKTPPAPTEIALRIMP